MLSPFVWNLTKRQKKLVVFVEAIHANILDSKTKINFVHWKMWRSSKSGPNPPQKTIHIILEDNLHYTCLRCMLETLWGIVYRGFSKSPFEVTWKLLFRKNKHQKYIAKKYKLETRKKKESENKKALDISATCMSTFCEPFQGISEARSRLEYS